MVLRLQFLTHINKVLEKWIFEAYVKKKKKVFILKLLTHAVLPRNKVDIFIKVRIRLEICFVNIFQIK